MGNEWIWMSPKCKLHDKKKKCKYACHSATTDVIIINNGIKTVCYHISIDIACNGHIWIFKKWYSIENSWEFDFEKRCILFEARMLNKGHF